MSTHRKHSSVVKNVAKVGLAAAIVGVPAFVAAPSAGATDWDSVAQCESGGNWNTNTGNGFSGGLQFTPSTWKANGGSGSPQSASKSEQVHVAENVKQSQGMSAWPNCGSKGGGGSSSSGSTGSNASVHHSGSSAVHSSSPSSNTSSSQGSSSQGPSSVGSTSTHHSASNGATSNGATSNGATSNGATSNSVTKGHGNYTVVSGDTLGKIAKKQGANGDWQKLYQKNKDTLQSPNTLFPGQKLQTS